MAQDIHSHPLLSVIDHMHPRIDKVYLFAPGYPIYLFNPQGDSYPFLPRTQYF